MVWIVKHPCGYSGIRRGEKAGGIKKTRGWGDFKVAKCAGLRLNDGWRIVLISVPPRRTCEAACHSHLCEGRSGAALNNKLTEQARSWDGDEENLCFSLLVSAHKSTLISKPVCWRPHHHTADHQGSLTVNVSSWTHICTSNAPQNRRNAGNPFFSPLISSVLLLPSKSAGFVTADWNIWLYLRKGPEINVFILCCFLFDD